MDNQQTYSAFVGETRIASGSLVEMLPVVKTEFDRDQGTLFLIFEEQSGRQVDFDLRGTLGEVLLRVDPETPKPGPGRPKMGVVSREVSLLPRHWVWLEQQPNGASAALRRLVDAARNREGDAEKSHQAREGLGRFMSAMAGNLPGYEAACRSLYAGDRSGFDDLVRDWPRDIHAFIQSRSGEAFWTKA
jgi:hypothetical protein